MHTIHPKCDISHFQYYLGQMGGGGGGGGSMHIGTQGLALFLNESKVQTTQLN